MWRLWTRREKEARQLLNDAKQRKEEMDPTIKELKKVYRENHIYAAILHTLGGS